MTPAIIRARQTFRTILLTLVLLTSLCCGAQTNIYSLAIYSGGHSYADLCSLTLPFAPHKYRLTINSWCADTSGRTILGTGKERASGRILYRTLEIECGSNSFSIPLESVPPNKGSFQLVSPGLKDSNDLVPLVIQCVTSRGGQMPTHTLPVIIGNWVHHSHEFHDAIVLDGDHFNEAQNFLEQRYGAPDPTIRSSAPVGNGRSITYTPQQIGLVLNLTADSKQTIVSVIGRKKP